MLCSAGREKGPVSLHTHTDMLFSHSSHFFFSVLDIIVPTPHSLSPSPLLTHLSSFTPALPLTDDDQFNEEKMYLIRQIRELNPDTYREPVATASASGVAKA